MKDRIPRGRVAVEHGVSAGLMIVGAAGIALSLGMDNPLRQGVGPGFVPLCTALVLTLGAVLQLLQLSARNVSAGTDGRQELAAGTAGGARRQSWLLALVLLATSLLVWSMTGYIVGIVLATLSVFAADRKVGPRGAVVFSLLLALGLWLLFERLLGTNLT